MPIPEDWSQSIKATVEDIKADATGRKYLGDAALKRLVLIERATSWRDIQNWINEFKGL